MDFKMLHRRYKILVTLSCLHLITCTQDTINYMADNLAIRYNVLSNFGTGGATYDAQLILENAGSQEIPGGSDPWQLYFCHIRIIDPDNILDGGSDLGDSGLRVFHVAGCQHRIETTVDFHGIPAGQSLSLGLLGQYWNVAKTDNMPNWYVSETGSEPRVVQSTADESLDFVGEYDSAEKWKRIESDNYNPYTASERYDMIDYSDRGPASTHVIPSPDTVDVSGESFNINTGDWVVLLVDQTLLFEAQYLADKLNTIVVAPPDAPSSHYIALSYNASHSSTAEYYRLLMFKTTPYITIEGSDPAGVFYGIQTLLSLREPAGDVPEGQIMDSPRFQYRGMHLDVSRHFHSKDQVLKILDLMATYKLNKLHLHVTDDEGWRLEIPGIEELTTVGASQCHDPSGDSCIEPQLGSGPMPNNDGTGHYTVEDYREILTYAASMHVQVIPEFDMPGHAYAAVHAMLARYRKYETSDPAKAREFLLSDPDDYSEYLSVQYFRNNVVNPCVDSVYNFVRHLIQQVKLMHVDIQPLTVFNFGGDEVPDGAWLNSTVCRDKDLLTTEDIKYWFIMNVSDIAHDEGLDLAAWEDGYNKNTTAVFRREIFESDNVYSYAWDNVWEWGGGENAYKFANDDYKVILSHATHLYYDHPYEPDPEERGYYWATRLVPTRKSFGYMPDSVYDNIDFDRMGNVLDKETFCDRGGCTPVEVGKENNIVGIQGQLWSETVRKSDQLEYMIFPRLLALAERAWHKAAWEDIADPEQREVERTADWEMFANALGHKELARLDDMQIQYAVPPPGARVTSDNVLEVKSEYPGLPLQYSSDSGATWSDHSTGSVMEAGSSVFVITRSANRARMSRPTIVQVAQPTSAGTRFYLDCVLAAMVASVITFLSH